MFFQPYCIVKNRCKQANTIACMKVIYKSTQLSAIQEAKRHVPSFSKSTNIEVTINR